MKKNIGDADRTARSLVGVAIGFVVARRAVTGTPAIVLGAASILILLTVLLGWSPLYALFRFSTRSSKDANPLEP